MVTSCLSARSLDQLERVAKYHYIARFESYRPSKSAGREKKRRENEWGKKRKEIGVVGFKGSTVMQTWVYLGPD